MLAAKTMERAGSMDGTRVLIVEDEALIAMALEGSLERLGLHVVGIASDRDMALELFQAHKPDLIMMDISIRGDADGIETAAELLGLDDVPIIFLTAYADDYTLGRAAEVSPYGYLIKPYDERSLTATVTMALERHRADMELRIMQATVNSAQIGILLVSCENSRRRIRYANDSFLAMSGMLREQIIGGMPNYLASDPEDAGVLRLKAAVREGSHASEVVMGHRKTGETFWSSVTVTPIYNRSAQLSHLAVFHMDLTEEREAQYALAETQRMELVGQLSAGLAHDFNNVLAVVTSYAERAQELSKNEEAKACLGELLTAARQGTQLTRKLLDFSDRRVQKNRASSDLGEVLDSLQPMVRRLAGLTIQVDCRYAPTRTPIALDEVDAEQIILTLVAYVRDALPEGGVIIVEVSRPLVGSDDFQPGEYVRLQVRDIEIGMDGETVSQALEPPVTTKSSGEAMGLGLATCRMLIEEAGGKLEVVSSPGQGTTFNVDFPLVESAPGLELQSAESEIMLDDVSCLILEDDGATRYAFARGLTSVGFDVYEAATAAEALELLQDLGQSLSLFICDMEIPEGKGQEVMMRARSQAPGAARIAITNLGGGNVMSFDWDVQILWKPLTASTLGRRALEAIGSGAKAEREKTGTVTALRPPVVEVEVQSPADSSNKIGIFADRVLLVDDDAKLAQAWNSVLQARGLAVVTVATAAEALKAVSEQSFGLAILEIHLPDGDGISLMKKLREVDALLPTLVVTGQPTVRAVELALQNHANGFLSKPVLMGELVDTCNRLISEGQVRRLQRQLLMTRSGNDVALEDLPQAEQNFHESLQQLYVVFQPIVRTSGQVFGYEALARSNGPYKNPAKIVAVAELLGKIDEFGLAVRRQVAATLMAHPDSAAPVFINLHPLEVRVGLLTHPEEPLLPWASRIVLEITERAQLESTQQLVETLRQIRAAGYRVALDDLGEGYAGLSLLVRLVPDVAKIDMSLVRDIHRLPIKQDTVSAVVSICRRAGIAVVAEGIETAEEAIVVQDLGCDLLQGYYFARPGPAFPTVRTS